MRVTRRQQPIVKTSPMANILSPSFVQLSTLAKFFGRKLPSLVGWRRNGDRISICFPFSWPTRRPLSPRNCCSRMTTAAWCSRCSRIATAAWRNRWCNINFHPQENTKFQIRKKKKRANKYNRLSLNGICQHKNPIIPHPKNVKKSHPILVFAWTSLKSMPGRGNQKEHPIHFLHVSEPGTIHCVHVVLLRVRKRAPPVHVAGGW